MFYTIDSIKPLLQKLREDKLRLVLATGFFDLLHSEHIKFLQKAKLVGDVLIVAVESDSRAKKIKGEGRPIEPQILRCQKLAEYADYVIALGDDFDNLAAYEDLMATIKPAIYAVSSHTTYLDTKETLTQKYGGKLQVVHEFNPEISTTQIINKSVA